MHFPSVPSLLLWALVASPVRCEDVEAAGAEEPAESPEEPAESPEEPAESPEEQGRQRPPRVTDKQLLALHTLIDKDGNGKISLDEVVAFDRETSRAMLEKEELDPNTTMTLEERLSKFQGHEGDEEVLHHRRMETAKFHAADADGDGVLVGPEVRAMLHPQMHDAILDIIVHQVLIAKDKDGDGDLNIEEFYQKPKSELSEEEQAIFHQLDTDDIGRLTEEKLWVWESGKFHANDMFKAFFKEADQDDDRELTVLELATMLGQPDAFDAATEIMHAWGHHYEV